MKKWILKAVIQKTISFLPFKHRINFLFQKYITKGVRLSDDFFIDKIIHASNHLMYFKKYNSKTSFKALELGSGWYPVIPIYLYLHGASEIFSIDIAQHITIKSFKETLMKFSEYFEKEDFKPYFNNIQEERKSLISKYVNDINENNFTEILLKFNIQFQIQDARKTTFDDNFFDLITSNNTFEHIYPVILEGILKEFKRILNVSGIMSHFIDMSDHFSHLDKSINIYNFLKFKESKWKFIDNSIQPQNRLRINQYKEIIAKQDFQILEEENRAGNEKLIENINLAVPFSNFLSQDNAVSHSHLVLKP